jgi:hypothetical protein
MLTKLLKALCILGIVLIQYGIVILNLNRYGIFQKFIELEFVDEHSKQESIKKYNYPYDRVY